MMKTATGLFGWAGAAMLALPLLQAGDALLRLDVPATRVEFTLGTTLHTVHGEFHVRAGSLRFDESTGNASGEIVVDARSAASGSAARDRRMQSYVLESELYPDIAFRPDRVEGAIVEGGPSPVRIHGVFSLHGAAHEVTVPAEIRLAGGAYAVTAHIEVPYVKWGMKNPGNFMLHVDDTVHVTVQTVVRRSPGSE